MIEENRFEKIYEIEGKKFGLLKKPWTISKNNVRDCTNELAKADIKTSLAPSLKEVGMQQIPVVNCKGEVFIGGRRTVGWEINGEPSLLVEIRDISDEDQMIASWTENVTKRDMNSDDEGRIFSKIMEKNGLTQEQLSKKLGVSQNSISCKINIYKISAADNLGSIPYENSYDSPKKLNYAKMVELLPLGEEERDKIISQIEDEGMTRDQIRTVIKRAKGIKALIETYDKEDRTKIEEAITPMLYDKNINTAELIHEINETTGSSQKTIATNVAGDLYSNQEEADTLFFSPRGGRCLGKKTETYWHGTVDPVKAKQLEKQKKENESSSDNNQN